MKDDTKKSELPPQAKPTDIPEAKVNERPRAYQMPYATWLAGPSHPRPRT